jgi:Protein of unknown function (DUF3105)
MTKKGAKSTSSASDAKGSRSRDYIFVGVFAGVIVLGAAFVMLNNQQPSPAAAPVDTSGTVLENVQTFPILSREHINPGDSHPAYNSNPPTNGWHYPVWADWGIYTQTLPDEQVIHNLEHGGVWISYRDSSDSDTVSKIQTLVSNDPDRMIVTYRPQDDSAIAVAAWGVLLKLDQFDDSAIRAFIQRYRYQGPENVAGNASG